LAQQIGDAMRIAVVIREGLRKSDGAYDEEGNVITEPTYMEGGFVDTDQPIAELAVHQVFPTTPEHVFWGVPTYHYRTMPQEARRSYLDRPAVAAMTGSEVALEILERVKIIEPERAEEMRKRLGVREETKEEMLDGKTDSNIRR